MMVVMMEFVLEDKVGNLKVLLLVDLMVKQKVVMMVYLLALLVVQKVELMVENLVNLKVDYLEILKVIQMVVK
jgi:hypothetical protein